MPQLLAPFSFGLELRCECVLCIMRVLLVVVVVVPAALSSSSVVLMMIVRAVLCRLTECAAALWCQLLRYIA